MNIISNITWTKPNDPGFDGWKQKVKIENLRGWYNYSEKIIYMPDTYWVNDSTKKISEKNFTREKLGLPKKAFVYCCFNQLFKLTPEIFDVWMNLLKSKNNTSMLFNWKKSRMEYSMGLFVYYFGTKKNFSKC